MKRNTLSKIYAIALTVAFVAGEILLFSLPTFRSVDGWIELLVGFLISIILAPTLHELGHISFAAAQKLKLVYAKFFCVKIKNVGGRYALSFANPFSPDQTQVVPTTGGDIEKRCKPYVLGGLIFGGLYFALILLAAVLLSCFGVHNGKLWGMLPYAAYLFLLNVMPWEYPSGKTDMLVFDGICRGENAEKAMLMAMDVQGRAYAGERYKDIEDSAFEFPVVMEDEPIYAVCMDLKYRRALEKSDFNGAADALKRLAQSEEYLTPFERERLAAEITYLHLLSENFELANKTSALCKEYLQSERATAKRILATFALSSGREEEAKILKEKAMSMLEKEEIRAEKLLEEELLGRLVFDKEE